MCIILGNFPFAFSKFDFCACAWEKIKEAIKCVDKMFSLFAHECMRHFQFIFYAGHWIEIVSMRNGINK